MHSFRIIVKTPDHLVGHDDQIPGKSGWIERESDGRWLVVVCDHATDTRVHYRRSSLASAISLFGLKLAGIEA